MPRIPDAGLPPTASRWVSYVNRSIAEILRSLDRLKTDIETTLKGITGAINGLTRNVNEIAASQVVLTSTVADVAAVQAATPGVAVGYNASSGFGLSSGWNTVATVNITVPAGKSVANIMANGGAAAADLTSGGLTNCYARIVIAGVAGRQFDSAKDAGASVVNNILTPNFGRSFAVSPGDTVQIVLQLQPLNAFAFGASAGNYGALSVTANFTN